MTMLHPIAAQLVVPQFALHQLEMWAQVGVERVINSLPEGLLIALFAWAVLRLLPKQNSRTRFAVWFLALLAVGCGLLAAPGWQPIARADWAVILALGLSGAIGQSLIVKAFVLAPASVVAPFDYTALLWGAMFDWLVWSTHAPVATFIGAALIVASGLYIMLRAHRDGRAAAASLPTALPADPPL